MTDYLDDRTAQRRHQRFLHEVEQSIREANREILHGQIPEIGTESFVQLATLVARLRADYLRTALQLAAGSARGEGVSPLLEALPAQRQAYEEAVHAFDALQRALERGYLETADGAAV